MIELLRGLSKKEVNLILSAARRRQFRRKSVITRQSEPADHLLLLWEGRARYFFETANGKKLILRWIVPGEIFGGAALVSRPSTYIVSTEAVRDSSVLIWDGPAIRAVARRFPVILENAIFLAADYISWYAGAHAVLTSKTAGERLAHVLVDLAPSLGQKVSGGGIELDVTNEELANSANISPFTTSRMMTRWHRSGAIHKRRGRILLRSPERFFRRVV
jgi:CRP/FNR family transcriptional regulator, nitrogen oxide reductase regulator